MFCLRSQWVNVWRSEPIFFFHRFRVNQFRHYSVHGSFIIFFDDFSKERGAVHGSDFNLFIDPPRSRRLSPSQLSLEKDEFEVDVVEHRSTEQPLEDENLSSFLRSDEGQSVRRRIGEAAQQRSKVVVGTQAARFIVDEINLEQVY